MCRLHSYTCMLTSIRVWGRGVGVGGKWVLRLSGWCVWVVVCVCVCGGGGGWRREGLGRVGVHCVNNHQQNRIFGAWHRITV